MEITDQKGTGGMMVLENKSRNTSDNVDDYRKAFQIGMKLAEELVSENICVVHRYNKDNETK